MGARPAYMSMINLCGHVAQSWPMFMPSTSTVDLSPSMSCRRRCGRGWPDFVVILRPSRLITRSAHRCHGVRRRPMRLGTVHIADSFEELVIGFAQVSAGSIPDRPFLLDGPDDNDRSDTFSGWDGIYVDLHPRTATCA